MNTGMPAGMPSLRSHSAWPSSCTKSSRTKSAAKGQPQSSVYAPTETTIVTAVVTKLNFAIGEDQEFQLEEPLEADYERRGDRPEDAACPHAQGALRVNRPLVEAGVLRRQRREERFVLGDVRAHAFKVARHRLHPS